MFSTKYFPILLYLITLMQFAASGQNLYDTIRTVKMSAVADHQSNTLKIQWEDDLDENIYSLYKKLRQDTSWGTPLIITGDQDTSYLDIDVEAGNLYEYRILKETGDSLGYAYLFGGVDYQPIQKKGDLLIIIDSIAADFVQSNLSTYTNLITSEGWIPSIVRISEETTVAEVKSIIVQYNQTVDSLTTVILMGNIAIPHSGNINPDAHNNHKGAWPADLHYGDLDGIWTDETVNNTSSAYPRIHNIPGDGNFDQDYIPGEIELAIGRLDFSELPIFDLNQYELLDRYLLKNIEYRTGQYQVSRRAVIRNTNPWNEGLGQNGIRNFVPLVSSDSIVYVDFYDAFSESFLWSYGGSSGSMINSAGLGSIITYSENNFQAVFTSYFGSYYGDYDFENNYLRTVLASGKVLSTAWVGAPNWYFHPMGMGLNLGFCSKLTQNNVDTYYAGYFPQSVTINLLGDPTLTAYIVRTPLNLTAAQDGNNMQLTWTTVNQNILGYQVLKKDNTMDYFEPIHEGYLNNTIFIDSCVVENEEIQYVVKAVKREITPSGSFINHSAGPIISVQTNANILPEADFILTWSDGILNGINFSSNASDYEWVLPDGTTFTDETLEIPYDQNGTITMTLIASNSCFSDTLEQTFVFTDIIDNALENLINIFPNPTNDYITLETTSAIEALKVYTTTGNCVFLNTNLNAGRHRINFQNFAEGNYILTLKFKDQIVSKIIFYKQ